MNAIRASSRTGLGATGESPNASASAAASGAVPVSTESTNRTDAPEASAARIEGRDTRPFRARDAAANVYASLWRRSTVSPVSTSRSVTRHDGGRVLHPRPPQRQRLRRPRRLQRQRHLERRRRRAAGSPPPSAPPPRRAPRARRALTKASASGASFSASKSSHPPLAPSSKETSRARSRRRGRWRRRGLRARRRGRGGAAGAGAALPAGSAAEAGIVSVPPEDFARTRKPSHG